MHPYTLIKLQKYLIILIAHYSKYRIINFFTHELPTKLFIQNKFKFFNERANIEKDLF